MKFAEYVVTGWEAPIAVVGDLPQPRTARPVFHDEASKPWSFQVVPGSTPVSR